MDTLTSYGDSSKVSPTVPRYIVYGVEGTLSDEVGTFIAKRLDLELYSVQQYVEQQAQRSVFDIVIEQGDSVLKESEQAALEQVLASPGIALLTGGTLDAPYACERVRDAQRRGAALVWCRSQLHAITQRLGFNQPRSIALGPVRAQLATMIRQREQLWEQNLVPDYCLDTTHGIDDAVQSLHLNG